MNIRAPKTGYDHPEKQSYRDQVWAVLAPAAIRAIRKSENAVVVLMPSMEGIEIKTAIAHGIPEERIVCIDSNPAKIAVSRWRREHPKCKFYGSMVSVAAKKMLDDNLYACAANLDFCTNFSQQLIDETSAFLTLHKVTLLRWAVTVSKGREGSALTHMVNTFGPEGASNLNESRIGALVSLIPNRMSPFAFVLEQGEYRISKTKMCWAVFDTGIEAKENIASIINYFSTRAARIYKIAVRADENPYLIAEKILQKMERQNKTWMKTLHQQQRNIRVNRAERLLQDLSRLEGEAISLSVGKLLDKERFNQEIIEMSERQWSKKCSQICADPARLFQQRRTPISLGGLSTKARVRDYNKH